MSLMTDDTRDGRVKFDENFVSQALEAHYKKYGSPMLLANEYDRGYMAGVQAERKRQLGNLLERSEHQ